MRRKATALFSILFLACTPADAQDRRDRIGELCAASPGPARVRLVADQCTASETTEERRACLETAGRFWEAVNTMCSARAGETAAGSCETACGAHGFDFAAWSCRSVPDRRDMRERCVERGVDLVRRRTDACVAACRASVDDFAVTRDD